MSGWAVAGAAVGGLFAAYNQRQAEKHQARLASPEHQLAVMNALYPGTTPWERLKAQGGGVPGSAAGQAQAAGSLASGAMSAGAAVGGAFTQGMLALRQQKQDRELREQDQRTNVLGMFAGKSRDLTPWHADMYLKTGDNAYLAGKTPESLDAELENLHAQTDKFVADTEYRMKEVELINWEVFKADRARLMQDAFDDTVERLAQDAGMSPEEFARRNPGIVLRLNLPPGYLQSSGRSSADIIREFGAFNKDDTGIPGQIQRFWNGLIDDARVEFPDMADPLLESVINAARAVEPLTSQGGEWTWGNIVSVATLVSPLMLGLGIKAPAMLRWALQRAATKRALRQGKKAGDPQTTQPTRPSGRPSSQSDPFPPKAPGSYPPPKRFNTRGYWDDVDEHAKGILGR